ASSRPVCSSRKALRGAVSMSRFQIMLSAYRDSPHEPALALEEARHGLERAWIGAVIEADPVRQDVAHLGVRHQHPQQGAHARVPRQKPLMAGIAGVRIPLGLQTYP